MVVWQTHYLSTLGYYLMHQAPEILYVCNLKHQSDRQLVKDYHTVAISLTDSY